MNYFKLFILLVSVVLFNCKGPQIHIKDIKIHSYSDRFVDYEITIENKTSGPPLCETSPAKGVVVHVQAYQDDASAVSADYPEIGLFHDAPAGGGLLFGPFPPPYPEIDESPVLMPGQTEKLRLKVDLQQHTSTYPYLIFYLSSGSIHPNGYTSNRLEDSPCRKWNDTEVIHLPSANQP
jgi:hypothetical protein